MIKFRFFLTCGNSSAVEHDLAKVGVASSNLVSRSIVFLLLITTFTFANKLNILSEAVLSKFENRHPCLNINNLPKIKPTSPLPSDFKDYEFIKIKFRNYLLRKRHGSFKAIFKTANKEKNIYFKFNIDAKVNVFKAKHKLYNDKILSKNDYEKISIKLDNLPSKVITCSMPKKLMTKNYISANTILTMNRFKYKKDVLRSTDIQAYIKDGILVLQIEATVLKDSNIGDIVKIKTVNGRLFRARLISKYKAIILE